MNKMQRKITTDGYSPKPITEGYQPDRQRGYQPKPATGSQTTQSDPAKPPSGGSSAMLPQKLTKD